MPDEKAPEKRRVVFVFKDGSKADFTVVEAPSVEGVPRPIVTFEGASEALLERFARIGCCTVVAFLHNALTNFKEELSAYHVESSVAHGAEHFAVSVSMMHRSGDGPQRSVYECGLLTLPAYELDGVTPIKLEHSLRGVAEALGKYDSSLFEINYLNLEKKP